MKTLTKHISINEDAYNSIEKQARLTGKSFSQFLIDCALESIRKDEELSLSEFLDKHCDYVSDEEQKEIDKLNLDYDSNDGERLTLEDFK